MDTAVTQVLSSQAKLKSLVEKTIQAKKSHQQQVQLNASLLEYCNNLIFATGQYEKILLPRQEE
jgi:hypothetical protein